MININKTYGEPCPNTRMQLIWLQFHRWRASVLYKEQAEEYLERATRGMSRRAASSLSGTGVCPLTDYAELYSLEKGKIREATNTANALCEEIKPLIKCLSAEQQQVILLFFNTFSDWESISRTMHKSIEECETILDQAIAKLEEPAK